MVDVVYQQASVVHIAPLVRMMRERDRQELAASSGLNYERTLMLSLSLSRHALAAFGRKGELLCLFGFVPITLMGSDAAPWLVGTTHLERYPKVLTRDARRFTERVQQEYPRLVNYVDARNDHSIRWLRALGFTLDKPEPFGLHKLPFHRFHKGF